MKVKKMMELAKKGDKTAKLELEQHYLTILKNYTKKKYGEEAEQIADNTLPFLIQCYFDNGVKTDFYHFLYEKINQKFKEKNQEKIIGNKVDLMDDQKTEMVINHYSNYFYNKIKKHSGVLSDEELQNFSYIFVKATLIKSAKSDSDIRNLMINYIVKEIKNYDYDGENLLKRYVTFVGINDNILDYFLKKYSYLLEKYENDRMYNCLSKNYQDIIFESLSTFTRANCNLENLIIKILHRKYDFDRNKLEQVLSKKNISESDYNFIYDTLSYLKNKNYNRFKNNVYMDNNWLKDKINEKYKDYLDSYISDSKNSNVRSYINTKLIQFFSLYVSDTRLEEKYKTDEYYSCDDYISKNLSRLVAIYPFALAEEELKKIYVQHFKMQYVKQRKTNVKYTLQRVLKQRIDFLNNSYQEQNIRDMASKYKQTIPNDVLEKEILNNVIDNLVSYYVSMGINNKETFESLLINTLLNFDKTVYEDLDRLKKQEQCKVLNRHKN